MHDSIPHLLKFMTYFSQWVRGIISLYIIHQQDMRWNQHILLQLRHTKYTIYSLSYYWQCQLIYLISLNSSILNRLIYLGFNFMCLQKFITPLIGQIVYSAYSPILELLSNIFKWCNSRTFTCLLFSCIVSLVLECQMSSIMWHLRIIEELDL